MSERDKYMDVSGAKARLTTIRLRTWTLTLALVVSFVFYILVNVTTNSEINWIDFVLTSTVQIIIYTIYFPEGELFGQKDKAFIQNKKAYNEKATGINQNKHIANLSAYCRVEYEERKKLYILNKCSKLGISYEEFLQIKQKSEQEIKRIECFETTETINGETQSKLIFFSKKKRKQLYNLLFKPLPVEENYPETIMGAIENNGQHAIKDSSKAYKTSAYIRKFFMASVVGAVFAYIGYTVKDGFGIAEVVRILSFITTMFTTAVMAFSSGETCSKVHKSRFYLALANFIDSFNEWNERQTTIKSDIEQKEKAE